MATEPGSREAFATFNSRKLARKRRLARIWRGLNRVWVGRRRSRAVVLMYHEVGDSQHGQARNLFAAQMEHLFRHVTVLSLPALLDWQPRDNGAELACAITFDDGYVGVYENALEILSRYGFPATVYVTTGAIGQTQKESTANHPGLYPQEWMMTWAHLRELEREGMAIGSHLCSHLDMTRLSEREARQQLRASKAEIESHLGIPCKDFAFPWGRFTWSSLEWVREAGYERAATVIHKPLSPSASGLCIPRFAVHPQNTMNDFDAILRGDWDYIGIVNAWKQPRIGPNTVQRTSTER